MISNMKVHGSRAVGRGQALTPIRSWGSWRLLIGLGAGLVALGAGPAPADKQAFLERPKMYLSFEITETGSREFGAGTPKDAITDGAYRINRSVKFEMPLEMAMPGSYPLSSMPMGPTEMLEQGRFIGWMAAPSDDDGVAEEQLATGKLDLAKNPMFVPVEFSVDDVNKFRYRDTPTEGWGTETHISKGHGTVYAAKSGMLMCDLKKMACDINNVPLGFTDGNDLVTVTSSSDVPGYEAKTETVGPSLHLPKPSQSLTKRLSGFAITLPDPITVSFSGPPAAASGGDGEGSTITIKVTMSSKLAAKAAGASR